MGKVNILHLSDLHFGVEVSDMCPVNRKQDHENALNRLKAELGKIPVNYPDWKPDVVAISGDIGWCANKTDYQEAAAFLNDILNYYSLSGEDIIICPGNHDLVRTQNNNLFNIEDREQAMKFLALDNLQHRCKPFESFAKFVQSMGIQSLSNNAPNHEALPYLYGLRDHKGLRFAVFNTAWNCRGDNDKGHLWVGESLVEDIENISMSTDIPPDTLVITLLHHPFADLHEAEQRIHKDNPVVQEKILKMSDLILTGHIHGEIRESDCIHGETRVFTSSAAYDKDTFRKGCQIIQLDIAKNCFSTLVLRFNITEHEWEIKENFESGVSLRNTKTSFSNLTSIVSNYIHDFAQRNKTRIIDSITLSDKIISLGGDPSKEIENQIELGILTLRIIGAKNKIRSYTINNSCI